MRVKTNSLNKKWLIILAIIAGLIVISAGYLVFASNQSFWPYQKNTTEILPENKDPNTPDPTYPTEKNQDESNTGPLPIEKPTPQNKGAVTVAIAYAGTDAYPGILEVRAFIPDVIEGNGICTAVISNSSKTVTETSKAFIDATTSQCEPIQVPTDTLSRGDWKVIVQYESLTYKGSSEPVTISL